MEYLMTYGWAILVIVIVIAVLAMIFPKPIEQCLFDQAGFLCDKPILMVNGRPAPTDAPVASLLHAQLLNRQSQSIVVTGIMCVGSRVQPPGDVGVWPTESQFERTMGYQESMDVGNFEDNSQNRLYVTCYSSVDGSGAVTPLTLRAGDSFSGRLYVAYRYADDPQDAPSKIVGANLVTQAQ